jgi:hypothetical protein
MKNPCGSPSIKDRESLRQCKNMMESRKCKQSLPPLDKVEKAVYFFDHIKHFCQTLSEQ